MDAREFDDLITRIAHASSRRTAVKGVLGGALAGVGVAAAADAKGNGKGKKGRKGKGKGRSDVASEHNTRNGKRTMCLCKEDGSTTTTSTSTTEDNRTRGARAAERGQARELVCQTKKFKVKKAKRALRKNPGSYRGPCVDSTTTSTSTSSTSTSSTSSTGQP